MKETFLDCPRLRYYEPKLTPELDDHGNVIRMTNPRAHASQFEEHEELREKVWPNELGMSCNPNNVEGFRALVDVINQNRNLSGAGFVPLSMDAAGARAAFDAAEEFLNSQKDA